LIDTKIIEIDPQNIEEEKLKIAAEVLRAGGTVAFPTETVYGLGANALDALALRKIFEAKGRPADNPLIVHIAHKEDVDRLVREIPKKAKLLMESFWPGPLTMVFKKSGLVPDVITAGLDTVAIRMPSHAIAKNLIEMAGVPVAAPSANLSGRPSPTQAGHVIEDMLGRVDIIISGGGCAVGLESTVLDVTEEVPVILRPGGVTLEALTEVVGEVLSDREIEGDFGAAPKSPGMKYTHYAPRAKVVMVSGDVEEIKHTINELKRENADKGIKVGIMATDETEGSYCDAVVISMGSRKEVNTIAENIFAILRRFDAMGVELILVEGIETKLVGHAVMNRLTKAAGFNVIRARR